MRVELENIHKRFGPVRANHDVSLRIAPGTLHGLLGENGAGKSTLMKVLSGFLRADRGEIRLDGQVARLDSPREAVARGVGMLHQDPLDFPALSVLDDFLLGSARGLGLRRAQARRELEARAAELDFKLDPGAAVSDLSLGERQQLEIVRLLCRGVNVLILDEPTTAISGAQKERLFSALRRLAAQGRTVIFVSHKLEEVQELCGRATVLAHGGVTGEVALPCSTAELVRLMFGRAIAPERRAPAALGAPVLRLDRLTVRDWRLEVKDLSLDVRAGEVIGLAGCEGNGQSLFLQGCAGLRYAAGGVELAGRALAGRSYRRYLDAGVAYLPANRLEEGLIEGLTVTEHVALVKPRAPFLVNWQAAAQDAEARIHQFGIRGRPETRVEELSGGNQQRLLLALLPPDLRLLLLEHPTRGLDLFSADYVWELLAQRARLGTAILFSSSDLEELLDRSDRILVFFAGRVRVLDARQTSAHQVGELIGGAGLG